jgi:hypothetical protein
MSLHAPAPEQLIVHFELSSQVTSLQAPSPTQVIVQLQPLGHVTLPQRSLVEQSTMHVRVAASHDVQLAGHCCTTQ